jgi:large subunit ribosomal protein L18
MKNRQRKLRQARERRITRVRARVKGTKERPRLAVYRTLRRISAQIIDDAGANTLVYASDREVANKDLKEKKPVDAAREVGKALAKKALAKGVKRVVFDRRSRRYHGRIKALAEGARQGGLEF